jgi:hypothetical protein
MNSILESNSGDEITFFGARSRADAECEIVMHNALVFAAKGTNLLMRDYPTSRVSD